MVILKDIQINNDTKDGEWIPNMEEERIEMEDTQSEQNKRECDRN